MPFVGYTKPYWLHGKHIFHRNEIFHNSEDLTKMHTGRRANSGEENFGFHLARLFDERFRAKTSLEEKTKWLKLL